ncbi:MAG: glucokinase, partial [Deltaproteobacteria bacterium]|nr:glucokinase [Deltaproteobacteria bacterium]
MSTTSNETLVLAGDVGGTKTNLGLFAKGKRRPIFKVLASYPSPQASDLESIVSQFLH